MKKTLVALAALSSMAAFGGTEFTIDSKVITSTAAEISAFDSIVGYSKDDAITNTGLSIDRLGYQNCTVDLHLSQMLHSVELASGQKYVVTAITMGFRYDQQSSYMPTGTSLTTTINEVTYTTGEAAFVGENGTTGTITWTFTTPIELDGTEDLQLSIAAESGKYGFTVGQNKDGNELVGVNDFTKGWKPIVRLSGTVTPEPATATLSLLALAGLVARRRRH